MALLPLLVGGLLGCKADTTPPTTSGVWDEFLGTSPDTLALPDYYANYYAYSFDRSEGDNQYIGLRIKGEFAHARYMSYNVYDAKEGSSYGSLTDFQMKPMPGHVNPFVNGSDPEAEERGYRVTVVPEGASVDEADNLFTFPSEKIQVLTVMIRYYVPSGGTTGDVPLPDVEAFDTRTQETVPLPAPYSLRSTPRFIYGQRLKPIFDTVVDSTLRFYRMDGGGQFNNADNIYLVNAVEREEDEVMVLRVKPPQYPSTAAELGQTPVRYWSFNLGNEDTTTPIGMYDAELPTASDGFVYLAIGDESVREAAVQGGFNFMPWTATSTRAVILYRNMLTVPDYPGHLEKVPLLDFDDPDAVLSSDAKNYIGEMAPTGKKVSKAEFLSNYGGIVPPQQ